MGSNMNLHQVIWNLCVKFENYHEFFDEENHAEDQKPACSTKQLNLIIKCEVPNLQWALNYRFLFLLPVPSSGTYIGWMMIVINIYYIYIIIYKYMNMYATPHYMSYTLTYVMVQFKNTCIT